jgi:hypothetical protein
MYATGLDPMTLEPVYVERDPHRKQLQKALILYREPGNAALVREALRELGREELAPLLLGREPGRRPPRLAIRGGTGHNDRVEGPKTAR